MGRIRCELRRRSTGLLDAHDRRRAKATHLRSGNGRGARLVTGRPSRLSILVGRGTGPGLRAPLGRSDDASGRDTSPSRRSRCDVLGRGRLVVRDSPRTRYVSGSRATLSRRSHGSVVAVRTRQGRGSRAARPGLRRANSTSDVVGRSHLFHQRQVRGRQHLVGRRERWRRAKALRLQRLGPLEPEHVEGPNRLPARRRPIPVRRDRWCRGEVRHRVDQRSRPGTAALDRRPDQVSGISANGGWRRFRRADGSRPRLGRLPGTSATGRSPSRCCATSPSGCPR